MAERGGRGQVYWPAIRYRYEVGDQRYEGRCIAVISSKGHRKYTHARRVLDSYRAGHSVNVHYDPHRPSAAVLQPCRGTTLRPILVIIPAAAMYVLFIVGPLLTGR